MWLYAARRVVLTIPILLGVTIICFALVQIAPGDPIQNLLSPTSSAADAARLRAVYGAMLAATAKQQDRGVPLEAIAGSPPDLRALPHGCSFAPRCRFAGPGCVVAMPPPITDAGGHMARCVRIAVRAQRLAFDETITPAA